MVNQWGRDGNYSTSGSRSSGAGGIIIVALIALILGGGGGYTAARLLTGATTGDLEERDNRIADLEKQISDLKFKNDGSADQESALRERIEELTKANETLNALVEENSGKASADTEAEIAALKKTIQEAGDLRSELTRARRSLQVSELQIIELEDSIKEQRREIDKLRKSLTDAATQGDAGTKALTEQIRVLEAALADSRKQASAAGELRKRIAALEDDLAQKTADLGDARAAAKALQKQADAAKAELIRSRKELEAAQAASEDSGGESEELRKQLASMRELLDAREKKVRELTTRAAEMQGRLDDAGADLKKAEADRTSLQASLDAMRGEREKLEADVAALNRAIESLKAAAPDDQPLSDVTVGGDEPLIARRDAEAVRAALEDMPGFTRLTPEKQSELARRLEDGECVAEALKATLGRVPAIALRNLIRDLGSKC